MKAPIGIVRPAESSDEAVDEERVENPVRPREKSSICLAVAKGPGGDVPGLGGLCIGHPGGGKLKLGFS